MTVQVDVFTLAILLLLVILLVFLLPMIWQMKKTGQEAELLLKELRRELIPTMRDLRKTTERIDLISEKVEKGTLKAESMLDSLGETLDAAQRLSNFLREDMARFAETITCFVWGVRAAGKVFLKGVQEKGG